MRLPGNAKDFTQRFEDLGRFTPLMSSIYPIELRGHLREFDDLFSLGENAGRIDQSGGESDCPIMHSFAHELFHLLEFSVTWRPHERPSHRPAAQCAVADQGGDIRRDGERFELIKEVSDVEGGHAAIPKHERGNSHAEKAFAERQIVDVFGMGMHIDEPWRDYQVRRIEFATCTGADLSDGDDPAIFYGDITMKRRIAASVDDPSISDHEIVIII